MAAYMKNVAPFLGIPAPVRRRALRTAWRDLPQPSSDDLSSAALDLVALPEREFHYGADGLIDEWSQSGDRWLVRAAIGHQRGWKSGTDVDRVLGLCDRHWADPEFFVAKAIGWALRDLAWIDATAVQHFLDSQAQANRVAIREVQRGLDASRRASKNDA